MTSKFEFLISEATDVLPDSVANQNLDEILVTEDEILDAYSNAVVNVAEKVSPSVVKIELSKPRILRLAVKPSKRKAVPAQVLCLRLTDLF